MLSKNDTLLLDLYIQSGIVSVMNSEGQTTYLVDSPDLPYFLTFNITYLYTIGTSIIAQYDIFAGDKNIASVKHNILSKTPENEEIKNILHLFRICSSILSYQEFKSLQHGFLKSFTNSRQRN